MRWPAARSGWTHPAVPCGHCRECRGGLEHLCTQMSFAGHSDTDGGLRELVAWPDRHLHLLPDGIALAVRSVVDLSWLTSDRFPLDDAAAAFASATRRDGLKVVVDVTPG